MSPALLAVLLALALAILCPVCIRYHAPLIEADLLARSRAALTAAGLNAGAVSMDGCHATLRGVAGSPEIGERARQIVGDLQGVHAVRVEEIPAPAPPQPSAEVREVQKKLDEMIRLRNVEFESGSARLTPRGRQILDEVAATLTKASTLSVAVEGHTDSDGDDAANLKLSQDRAAAVQAYLVSKGITAGRMSTAGFGETRPIADNSSPQGKQSNRRIEFRVKEQ